ncbi:MAG: HAD hydrolase-like protein [Anaerolineales bacterium]|nr:HAD hydrolase-like protein [Anaerolineales bacterium]
MSLTLLFDLDDTLLDTNIEAFIPAYFQSLSEHVASYVSPNVMLPALSSATKLMMSSDDPSRTLQCVFEADFYEKLGVSKQKLTEAIDYYYDNVFPGIEVKTKRRPDAAPLIEWALSKGYRLAVATDPLFPRKATLHRLRWAGLDPSQFEIVSTFEDFHFTKAFPEYYAEVLGQLGWPDGPVLMVGNDAQRDLIPANRLGLKTYFIDGDPASSPGFEAGCGKLADLRPWLESTDLSTLEPSFKSPDAILAIMHSTPAAINSLLSLLTKDEWQTEPAREDWAMNEIICHLRDTEREIHHMQLKLMLERDGAFIPRPDTGVWASERDYLHEDGKTALDEFTHARLANVDLLSKMDGDMWSRKARHAIFGPTDFLEVAGFMADHDRMHVQQIWKTLQSLRNGRV